METFSVTSIHTARIADQAADEAVTAQASVLVQVVDESVNSPLRAVGRPDVLTAQRVEVGIILQAMLGTECAAEYLANNGVSPAVATRVFFQPHLRRGKHDACGIRC